MYPALEAAHTAFERRQPELNQPQNRRCPDRSAAHLLVVLEIVHRFPPPPRVSQCPAAALENLGTERSFRTPGILEGAGKIADRFVLRSGHVNGSQLAGPIQSSWQSRTMDAGRMHLPGRSNHCAGERERSERVLFNLAQCRKDTHRVGRVRDSLSQD